MDRDALRFLWWNKNKPDTVEVHRHARVVFRVTSSPFLLAAVIALHLERVSNENDSKSMKSTIQKLRKSFYVDNCVTSVDTHEQLEQFKDEAIKVIATAGFDLRGWEYSHSEEPSRLTAVLGLTWDKKEDTIMLRKSSLTESVPEKITKRVILAASHKIFDPIGFECPVLLRPKMLLQTIVNLDWDTEVAPQVKRQFIKWYEQLEVLQDLKIPPWMFEDYDEEQKLSLHIFVDASQVAYAAVIYARLQSSESVNIQLVEAKSRVAPTKKIIIPRLELLAATIGARLMRFIQSTLEYEQVEIYYWSDSSTVLSWIHRQAEWATFVWNRVQEIRQISDSSRWRHIPGSMNPADLPSRGCTSKQLIESRWWEGPEWLKNSPDEWPTTDCLVDEEEVCRELKKSATKIKISSKQQNEDLTMSNINSPNFAIHSWYLRYFSRYTKIIRLVGWIRRFIFNTRKNIKLKKKGELSAREFSDAEMTVMCLVQRESFTNNCDPKINHLNTFIDKNGLIRLKSLIYNRKDEDDFRRPVVLDPQHLLVQRLIQYHHIKLQHTGVQTVLNLLRERFWILTGRRAVRKIIKQCITCKRFSSMRVEAAPAALPENRVRDAVAFEVIGIDFAGPLYLKDGQKAWICLFTCAVFRTIHLELTSSLSTEAFIEALRRFIARRGRPAVIYSDNGTSFVGTKNLLRKINWNEIQKYSTVEKIDWHFNPPSAAWWGGWWERLVRLIKELLRRVLKKSCLSYEEMCTTLYDCESVKNSRPITYLSEDAAEPTPLTPAMFLHENKESEVPDLDRIDDDDLRKRLKYRRNLREQLRRRFRIEYLGQLSRRQVKKADYKTIKVGDIVLVGNDQQKRLDWPLAKIVELMTGRDGVIRVVRLKTAAGELVRPVQRIFPLEINSLKEVNVVREHKKKSAKPSPSSNEDKQIVYEVKTELRTRSGRHVKAPDRLGFIALEQS